MPEADAKPTPKKAGKFATRKIGPLPVWAWALGALVFVGVVWYMRKNAGDDTSVSVSDSDYGQSEPIAPEGPFTGGNGAGSGGGFEVIPLPEPILPPSAPFPDWPYQPEPAQPIYEPVGEPVQTQPVSEPTQPEPPTKTAAPTKQTQFTWSGKTFRKGDLAAFRKLLKALPKSSIYSGANGYATWAANHPKVVADFGWPKK